jgi:hypothetical protein
MEIAFTFIIIIVIFLISYNYYLKSKPVVKLDEKPAEKQVNKSAEVSIKPAETPIKPVLNNVVDLLTAPVVNKPIIAPVKISDIDCIMGLWSECDLETLTQTRSILTAQSGKGETCGVASQNCIPDIACKQSEWGICDAVTKTQTRTTTVAQSGKGAACGAQFQSCIPDIPCKTSDWAFVTQLVKLKHEQL